MFLPEYIIFHEIACTNWFQKKSSLLHNHGWRDDSSASKSRAFLYHVWKE
jgi:hypothetical protein